MTLEEVTGLVTAVTALVIAIGGVLTAIKLLREVRVGNDLTQTGIEKTDVVHHQLNSAKKAADQLEQKYRKAMQFAGVAIPDDDSLEEGGDYAVRH